jgi:shikimate kinase
MGHVWLIGMMGSGKSTVGRLVAETLERPFYDTDAAVEEAAGASIMEIFERFGEENFRDRERSAIAGIVGEPSGIVATGGGAVLDPANVEAMRSTGTVVLLTANPEVLVERLAEDGERPLVLDGIETAIRSIARARNDLYLATADAVVDAAQPVEAVIGEVVVICDGL